MLNSPEIGITLHKDSSKRSILFGLNYNQNEWTKTEYFNEKAQEYQQSMAVVYQIQNNGSIPV
jgi:hypothetical protein